jgi:hypothetical protein
VIKPLWAIAGVAVLGTAGVAVALVVASPGGEEEVVQQVETATPRSSSGAIPEAVVSPLGPADLSTPTPEPPCDPERIRSAPAKLFRWLDLTVLVPEEGGFQAYPETIPAELRPPGGTQGLVIVKIDPSTNGVMSGVRYDAESGAVVNEQIVPEDRECVQAVMETVKVSPFDPARAQWPYNGDPPASATREGWAGISVIKPDPSTGMVVEFGIGSGVGRASDVTPGPCGASVDGQGVELRNGRSSAGFWLDPRTSSLCKTFEQVDPQELDAFERYFSSIEPCHEEADC